MASLLRKPESASAPPTSVDDHLALQVQLGSAGFDLIFDRFFPQVYWYCLSILREEDAAEDAAILVMTRINSTLHCYRPDLGTFRTWLFHIAHNVAIDQLRIEKRHASLELMRAENLTDPQGTPEDEYLLQERRRLVLDLLPQLPAMDQQVVSLRLAGLDSGEICALLGKSRNAVDSAQSRGIARLRALVTHEPARTGQNNAR